jgi:hypothetical protein
MNMKQFKYILLYSILAGVSLFSCDDQLDKVTFKGGSAPVLSVSSTDDLVLNKSEANFSSLQFQWTNPDYEFSNGVSTQDVSYVLQVDTTGSNFSNPKIVGKSFTKDVSVSFTVKDFNNTLAGLELKDYVPHEFEFRIAATLSKNVEPLYSNVIKVKVTTYLDVVYPVPDNLYITGAATPKSWMAGGDPEEVTQKFTKVNPYTFVLDGLQINGGSEFLLVPVYGDWGHKYGYTGDGAKNNTSGDFFKPEGNNFLAPAASKAYKITVNFKTGKYSFE